MGFCFQEEEDYDFRRKRIMISGGRGLWI